MRGSGCRRHGGLWRSTCASYKGYLFYSRQPPFCRRCRRYGHNDGGCEEQRCLQCAQLGHIAKECTVPKSCHSCGSLDHLMRDCKGGGKQYREGMRGEEGMKDRCYFILLFASR
uniref:CCHC-type domain-containing protein n=1 Tax=Cyprinus carpio TaxID=7962 RepID=A0A8C1QTQ9_CYPCA